MCLDVDCVSDHVRSDSNKKACFLFPGRAFIEGDADAPNAAAANEGDADETVTAQSSPGEEIVTQAEMEEAWARAREMEVSSLTADGLIIKKRYFPKYIDCREFIESWEQMTGDAQLRFTVKQSYQTSNRHISPLFIEQSLLTSIRYRVTAVQQNIE